MSGATTRDEGSSRSILFATAAAPFLIASIVGLFAPGSAEPATADGSTLAMLLAQIAAILLAIGAIWAGDEVTRRGRLGRRLGMAIVLLTVATKLAGGALLG